MSGRIFMPAPHHAKRLKTFPRAKLHEQIYSKPTRPGILKHRGARVDVHFAQQAAVAEPFIPRFVHEIASGSMPTRAL
jgi:hypothetical protein